MIQKNAHIQLINGILIFTMVCGPSLSLSQNLDNADKSIDLIIPNVSEPLQQIANNRVQAMNAAPAWVKELRSKTVSEYFPENLDDKNSDWSQGIHELSIDAQRLHEYFEQSDKSGLYKNFIEKKLKPFIKQIDKKKLSSAMRNKKITRPIGEWTVETLVITEQVAYLGRYPNFIRNTLGLITGPHLRGASAIAGVIVFGAIGAVTANHFNISPGWTIALIVGALGGAFQAGPLAAILNSATGWFIQPTTEFIRLISSRYTGPWEQKINHFYDKLKPRSSSTQDATRNETPNIPSVEKDGMDFAGMSHEEQKENWNKNLKMWVAVAKTFGQLLRDTHHAGRVLMMISWSDEQLTTTLVETMDTKLLNLAINAETLLSPYKTAILVNPNLNQEEKIKALAQFEFNFDSYQKLNEDKWMNLDHDKNSLKELENKIASIQNELLIVGVTKQDVSRLAAIQTQRVKAMSTIITALTLNEIRSFNVAEANRNLEGEARQAQRVIRNGFHLQDYVNQYREHVQRSMEQMGYKNSRKPLSKAAIMSCEGIF